VLSPDVTDEPLARPAEEPGASGLRAHSEETKEFARQFTPEAEGDFAVARDIVAALHDFGKLSPVYQQDFRETAEGEVPDDLPREHAPVGAYAGLFAAYQRDLDPMYQTAVFVTIGKHHGHPPNVAQYAATKRQEDYRREVALKQLGAIDERWKTTADEMLSEACGETHDDMTLILTHFVGEHAADVLGNARGSEELYRVVHRLYATLTLSDKLSAANLSPLDPDDLPVREIDRHVESITPANPDQTTTELNELREAARQDAIERAQMLATSEQSVGRITLPTGFGKTLTGLSAGLTMTEATGGNLVYALPYTSIVDQTDTVIRDIYSNISPSDPEYTIHQHRRETRTDPPDEDLEARQERLLAETWQSSLTLTTFVQLLESVAGPTNAQSLKLPNLKDSVVVLDEPQAVPTEWWELTAKLVQILTEEYDATVILMTATQPEIARSFEYTDDPLPLTPNAEDCYDFIGANPRVRFEFHASALRLVTEGREDPLDPEDAADLVFGGAGQTTLTVCNTVDSTKTVHEALQSKIPPNTRTVHLNEVLDSYYDQPATEDVPLADYLLSVVADRDPDVVTACLTTRLRPVDREALISALHRFLDHSDQSPYSDIELYVTSTQLVEAGVDLSFDALYRDFAPFSSFVQAAGRCNRNFETGTKPVTILYLDHEGDGDPPARLVYQDDTTDFISPTVRTVESLLDGDETISEQAMIENGPETYYQILHDENRNGAGELVEYVSQARFEDLREASLIDDDYPTVDITVLLTNSEKELLEDYCQARREHDWEQADTLQTQLQQLTISVPTHDPTVNDVDVLEICGDDGENQSWFYLDAKRTTQYQLDGDHGLDAPSVEDRIIL
jgi:CRISPR-associated endonuclease Cas3-HD